MTADGRIPPSPYEFGLQALNEGRHGDALHAFEQAYHLNPHDPALHEAIGRLYYEQGNYARARQYLQYALYVAPQATGPWYHLALTELREGNSEQAIGLLRRCLQIDPNHEAARQALEDERVRARVAQRLPTWQPGRPFRPPLILRPPKQVGPDGRERPAPLRAPHHCANCYFRAGRERQKRHAVRYHWWNLGLVGMVFGGWPVYLLWTYASRERRFAFEPLYCSTCATNRRLLSWAGWVLTVLAPIFGLATLIAVANVRGYSVPAVGVAVAAVAGAICSACVACAVLARLKEAGQRGVRLRIGGEDEALFQFSSAEYEEAFLSLNQAFVVEKPQIDVRREADSFLPAAEEEHGPEPPSTPPTPAPPADDSHAG